MAEATSDKGAPRGTEEEPAAEAKPAAEAEPEAAAEPAAEAKPAAAAEPAAEAKPAADAAAAAEAEPSPSEEAPPPGKQEEDDERLVGKIPDRVHTWPHLTRLEMLVGTAVMALMTIWSIVVDAPLEEPANPTKTPNPSKAPWYFLGLQELLVYFDPWFAGVVLPSMIIIGLMIIPYVDVNPKGNGYYCFRDRWFAVSTFLFGFLVLWIATIIIGTFMRGPGWYLYLPGEYWDPHKTVAITNVDWPEKLGIVDPLWQQVVGGLTVAGFLLGLPLVYWKWRRKKSPALQKLGALRYGITSFFFMSMLGVVLKMILRWGFNVKYIFKGPMGFNI